MDSDRTTDTLPPLDVGSPEVQRLTRRIFFSRFSRRLTRAGWEADDALQEIYVGLITRQVGKSRFNPRRASLSKYLFTVISSITSQLLDRRYVRDIAAENLSDTVDMDLSNPGPDLSMLFYAREKPNL